MIWNHLVRVRGAAGGWKGMGGSFPSCAGFDGVGVGEVRVLRVEGRRISSMPVLGVMGWSVDVVVSGIRSSS